MSKFHIKTGITTALLTAVITIPLALKHANKQAAAAYSEFQQQISLLESTNSVLTSELEKRQQRNTLPNDAFRELLRLRSEVGLLREQLGTASQKESIHDESTDTDHPNEDTSSNIDGNFYGTYDTTIPPQSVMAIGGWEISPGKRLLLFLEPTVTKTEDQQSVVTLITKNYQIPDNQLESTGLQELRDDTGESNRSIIFPREHFDHLIDSIHQQDGINKIAAPGITTLLGQQGSIRVSDENGNGLEINFLAKQGEEDSLNLIVTAKGQNGS